MPCILEFREIDGAMWVKVDLANEVSPVSLYTDAEMKAHDNNLIEECARVAGDDWWEAVTNIRALKSEI